MNNTEVQILKNFENYFNNSKIEQIDSKSISLNDQVLKGGSALISKQSKITRSYPSNQTSQQLSKIAAIFVSSTNIEIGGDFDRHEIYKIPDSFEIIYSSVNKTSTTIDGYLVNLILRQTGTDNYRFCIISGTDILQKDITLNYRTDDLYTFQRLKNINFQNGFFSGYDISNLKESYTETNPNILSFNMSLGYGLVIYRNSHVVNESPIQLQTFTYSGSSFYPYITLPTLNIDSQNFTIQKIKSYISGKLKTTITKTVGSTVTIIWEYIETSVTPVEYEPTYTYTIVRNPPFTDSRDSQCSVSGLQEVIFKITVDYYTSDIGIGTPTDTPIEKIYYYQLGITKNYTDYTNIIITSRDITDIQTGYYATTAAKPPYQITSGFLTEYIIASTFTSESYVGSGHYTGQRITNAEFFIDCSPPLRSAEPYNGSIRIESYKSDLTKNEDINISDPIYNNFTNTSLPDVEIIKSTIAPTDNNIKSCTITPIYPITVPVNLPDTNIDLHLRNKDNYSLASNFGFPVSVVVKNGDWGFAGVGTITEGGDTPIDGGDIIYQQFDSTSHDSSGLYRISGGWELGYITKSKEFETDVNTVICIGDKYSLLKIFVVDNTNTISNCNITLDSYTITGDFKYAEKGQFIIGSGIKPNTQILSVDNNGTQITITDKALATTTVDLILKGESTYTIKDLTFYRKDLFTGDHLFTNPKPTESNPTPSPDSRNNRFIFDISLGKPNLIDMFLYIVTQINDDQTADCIIVDLSQTPPSFSTVQIVYNSDLTYQDISMIQ